MSDRVIMVSDDLTGALVSAAGFAMRGARVRVACRPADLPEALASDADVVAVVTGTRDGPEAEATRVATEVAAMLEGQPGIRMKKIDSRLKGHIRAELDALAPPGTPLLVNPAVPRLGRLCESGHVTGAGVDRPIPIADRLGRAIEVPDTTTTADIPAQLPADLAGTWLVGAAGLAEALAERLWPTPRPRSLPRPGLPALLAIGSRDPVTDAQIAMLSDTPITEAPNGAFVPLPPDPIALLRMTPGTSEITAEQAGLAFAATVATAYETLRPATLFACGGESAMAMLTRLGVGQLDLLGEILPGVPIARPVGEGSLTLITKSGGFGPPDTLVKLVKLLTSQ